jgi:drug/metabolite transporter (DMT)-like permease
VVNAGMYSYLYVIGLLALPFLEPLNAQAFSRYWLWFLGGGICFALGNIFGYKVVTHLDAGISAVLGTIGTLFTIALAALVLHEELSPRQAVGGFIILAAICYVLTVARQPGKHRMHRKSWLVGLGFSLLASIFYTLAIVNEKFLLSKSSASTYLLFGWGAQLLTAYALALMFQRSKFRLILRPSIFKLTFLGGITRGLSGLLFILALVKSNNVALMTVVTNLKLIIIVLLGAWLLNEKQKITEKLTAAFLALAGLSIILWK